MAHHFKTALGSLALALALSAAALASQPESNSPVAGLLTQQASPAAAVHTRNNAHNTPHPSAQPSAGLEGGTWLLQSATGVTASGAYLRFQGQQVQGNDACNSFRISYESGPKQALRFAPGGGAATLMACAPDKEVTAKALQTALAQTQSYRIQGQQLELLGSQQQVLAVFRLQSDRLEGSRWQVQGLNNGKNAVVSQASVESLKLAFLPAGKLEISTPCGPLQSHYRVASKPVGKHASAKAVLGQRIQVSKPRASGPACAKSDAAYADYCQVQKALKHSQRYQITGERLELRDKKGALQISAQLAP